MIGVQPVDHTHPTFWSSHSHVISAYLYTDPIISPPGFHQQNLTWNKCSCFRMIAGPHISSCYPSSSVHLTKVSILHWIVKVEICLSQWKLKSFYRYEKDWPMQIADSAMTSTFSNNAWKNVICLWMVTQSHRSTNTTQYLITGMNISMFSKQILVSTLVCCSIWEFTEKNTF